MSSVNPEELKSPSDSTIPFFTRPEAIGVAQIIHDTLNEFGVLIKSIKIVNEDGSNNLTYRTQSPSNVLQTVPPNSEDVLDEWTSFLEINPDGTSGSGMLQMDLVELKNARKNPKSTQVVTGL